MGINLIDGPASSLDVFIIRDIFGLMVMCQWMDEGWNECVDGWVVGVDLSFCRQ